MKRIISIVLSLIVALGTVNSLVFADVADTSSYAFDIVKELGIINNNISLESEISRADAVKYILNLKNITSYQNSGVKKFKDISVYHEYYSLTDTAEALGIIKGDGDGFFRPDDTITPQEATVMIMRATGYSNLVDTNAGIYDYVLLAGRYGFTNNVDMSAYGMTYAEFAKLIYNSFKIGIIMPQTYGDGISYEVQNKTSLHWLGLAMGEGVLTDNEYASVHYTVNSFQKGIVIIDNIPFKTGTVNANACLGYNVEYFYYDTNKDTKELRYIAKKNNEEKLMPLSYDFYEKSGKLCYEDENGKEKQISIDVQASFIVNGSAKPLDINRIANAGSTGEVIFIDNTNNISGWDVVILNDYANDIVMGCDTAENTLNLRYAGKINLPDVNYGITEFLSSEKTKLNQPAAGTVISYISSDNGLYLKGIVSEKTIEGKAVSVENDSITKITVEDTEYLLSKDCRNLSILKAGNSYKYLLNFNNEIVEIKWQTERNYAFVLAAKETNSAIDKKIMAKLYTLNGVASYELADKLKFNGVLSNKTITEKVSYINTNAANDLITYEVNSEGKISDITFCEASTGNLLEDSKKFVKYAETGTEKYYYNGNVVDVIGVGAKYTQVFFIPEGENVDEEDCQISTLVRDTKYSNLSFYDVGMDGNVGIILARSKASNNFSGYPEAVVFEKKVKSIDSEGNPCEKVYYYSEGNRSSVIIDDEISYHILSNSKTSYNFSQLKFGDIFAFETNLQGRLDRFTVFFTAEDKNADIAVTYGGGVGQNQERQLISGNLCYFNEGVASLNFVGGFQIFYYDEAVPVYKINTQRKIISEIDMSNLQAKNYYDNTDAGQRVILFGRRYTLWGAYIYE